jgi:hypothetical protein
MMVMLGNHSSPVFHYWAGKYPGKLGWLIGPSAQPKTKLRPWVSYALDNDAFAAWQNGTPWDEGLYFRFLDWVATQSFKPMWATVPDVVADASATLANWAKYAPRCRAYGFGLAFVMQDGVKLSDVPSSADLVFIGGTYSWKWQNLPTFCKAFPRVHVGRVNTLSKVRRAAELGVESVDGTGWFRRPEKDFWLLEEFLKGAPGLQMEMKFKAQIPKA